MDHTLPSTHEEWLATALAFQVGFDLKRVSCFPQMPKDPWQWPERERATLAVTVERHLQQDGCWKWVVANASGNMLCRHRDGTHSFAFCHEGLSSALPSDWYRGTRYDSREDALHAFRLYLDQYLNPYLVTPVPHATVYPAPPQDETLRLG